MDRWLVTGAAGFIGSHLVDRLLAAGKRVIGLDNHSANGNCRNLYGALKSKDFSLHAGDIRDRLLCNYLSKEVDVVVHLAAKCSVVRSIEEPGDTFENNVTGFNNVIDAARGTSVKKFIYASSSAVYGDDLSASKTESIIGKPLSPYATSKRINEIVAESYHHSLGLSAVGLRFFNIFGPRQQSTGGYAAVIPNWITSLLELKPCILYGSAGITRDFCYVDNAVDAILAAATADKDVVGGKVYNIGMGSDMTLDELSLKILKEFCNQGLPLPTKYMQCADWRKGDIPCSRADIERAKASLGYTPRVSVGTGLAETIKWYRENNGTST